MKRETLAALVVIGIITILIVSLFSIGYKIGWDGCENDFISFIEQYNVTIDIE